MQVVNHSYGARSAEGVSAQGEPLITRVKGGIVFLPLIAKAAP
jgi:hypothetical protein